MFTWSSLFNLESAVVWHKVEIQSNSLPNCHLLRTACCAILPSQLIRTPTLSCDLDESPQVGPMLTSASSFVHRTSRGDEESLHQGKTELCLRSHSWCRVECGCGPMSIPNPQHSVLPLSFSPSQPGFLLGGEWWAHPSPPEYPTPCSGGEGPISSLTMFVEEKSVTLFWFLGSVMWSRVPGENVSLAENQALLPSPSIGARAHLQEPTYLALDSTYLSARLDLPEFKSQFCCFLLGWPQFSILKMRRTRVPD